MKKRIVSLCLAFVLALSLASTALAVDQTEVKPKDSNVQAQLLDGGKQVQITVNNLEQGQQYLILMVSGIYDNALDVNISASTIRYIDQDASTDTSVTFTVYPDSMQSSTILLSGGSAGLRIVATVEVPYKIGDVNLDGARNAKDITRLAQHIAKVSLLTGNGLQAADVNQDGTRNAKDITRLAQHIAKVLLLPD